MQEGESASPSNDRLFFLLSLTLLGDAAHRTKGTALLSSVSRPLQSLPHPTAWGWGRTWGRTWGKGEPLQEGNSLFPFNLM